MQISDEREKAGPAMSTAHDYLRALKRQGADHYALDDALAACPDAECLECGRIICPEGEPMHFHHDGCPACDGSES